MSGFDVFLDEFNVGFDFDVGMAKNTMPATEAYSQFRKARK